MKPKIQKKKLTKKKLTLVLDLLNQGIIPSKIAKKLKVSKPYISKVLRPLKAKGLIKNLGYGVWEIKEKLTKSSLGLRDDKPRVNLHALQIKFPILEGKIEDKDWGVINKLNNWIPKYKSLTILGGLKLRNNNNKSITVFANARNLSNLNEVDELAYKIRDYLFEYFEKEDIILDKYKCRTSNLNLATEDKHSEGMLRKGEKFELKFNKKAEKVFENDNMDSKAWVDGSPFKFTTETNDKDWKREYLRMPFTIRDIAQLNLQFNQSLRLYNQNIVLHLDVLNKIKNAIKGLNKKINHISTKVMKK